MVINGMWLFGFVCAMNCFGDRKVQLHVNILLHDEFMACKDGDFTLQPMAHTNHKFPIKQHGMY